MSNQDSSKLHARVNAGDVTRRKFSVGVTGIAALCVVAEHSVNEERLGRIVNNNFFTGAADAIANAVFHATGKRVRDLPITLDKLI